MSECIQKREKSRKRQEKKETKSHPDGNSILVRFGQSIGLVHSPAGRDSVLQVQLYNNTKKMTTMTMTMMMGDGRWAKC